MVDADLSAVPATRPAVLLVEGDDASGLAAMIAEVLRDNLRDYRGRARVASLARGAVVLRASDRDIEVTLTFGGSTVTVADGAVADAPVLSGAWLDLAQMCAGQLSPWRALFGRRVEVAGTRRPAVIAAAGFVLSVPPGYYGDTAAARRRTALVVVVVIGFAGLVLAGRARARGRRGR